MKFTKLFAVILPIMAGASAFAEPTNPNILVAYYSLTGKTEKTATAIAAASHGTLYKIEPDKLYPADKTERRKILNQEIENNYLPPLKPVDINPENYDIIFIGSPVWANHISQPVKSFLAKYNLTDKNVIPFVTHSGGGRGQSFDDVAALCKNCIVDMDGWSSWGSGVGRKLTKWVTQQINDIK